NAQVPDGIAVAVSTISALNTYIPIEQSITVKNKRPEEWVDVRITKNTTNINLADRNQLAVLFVLMFDEWKPPQINQLVVDVIKARSQTKPTIDHASDKVFGISPDDFLAVVNRVAVNKLTRFELGQRAKLVGLDLR